MKRNPHMRMVALDPPCEPGQGSKRRVRCDYCGDTGTWDELCSSECSYVYPPCEHCGQTPECAADCKGMAALFGELQRDPDVYVAGQVVRADGLEPSTSGAKTRRSTH